MSPLVAMGLLVGYLMLSADLPAAHVLGEFKITYFQMGRPSCESSPPSEHCFCSSSRLSCCSGTPIVCRRRCVVGIAGMFVTLLVSAVSHAHALRRRTAADARKSR